MFTFKLSEGSNGSGELNLDFDIDDFLISGSMIGDADGDQACYLPFFVSDDSHQSMWYVGTIFMQNYYTVFDMTPYTERQ